MSKNTSLKLSKQLKEAGAKQESEKAYSPHGTLMRCTPVPSNYTASFNTDELLEGLPETLELPIREDDFGFYTLNLSPISGGWIVQYIEATRSDYAGDFSDASPAEALGKLYLWCLESGHCNA